MNWIKQQQNNITNTFANWQKVWKSCHKQQIFGLDIGSSAIKIVQLRKDENGFAVTGAGIAFVNDPKDENHKDTNYSKAIRQCLQWSEIKNKFAVCGVNGEETAVRNFNFPSLLPDEVEGAVQLEAKQVCPFNTDDGVIDYQITEGSEKEIKGFLVVASNKILKEKARFIKESSLSNVLMDIDGLALMNCMRYCRGDETGTFAILNIGYEYTSLAILGEDNLPFIRDINFGGKEIIEHVTLETQFNYEVIQQVLRGGEDKEGVKDKINQSLESACHKLISNITETLYYDAVHRKSEIVDKIYLCGGFALVDGFPDLLKGKLPTETVLWNPFDKIPCDSSLSCGGLLHKDGPAFAVAAGLAMRQI
ncbi:MAG: type IV pilus assembly protein PilM [Phycisphaerales bacterium]